VKGIWGVIEGLKGGDSGMFLGYTGEGVPW